VEFPKYLQQEFGIQPGLIQVREFSIPEERIAVYQFPKHFREFVDNPQSAGFDDDDRRRLPESINQWNQLGQFVLEWGDKSGDDFWLNSEGEVVSS